MTHYITPMCSIYSFKRSAEETRSLLDYLERPDFPPRPFITPGSPIAIIRQEMGARHFALVRWGLVPAWVKEIKPGRPLTNARAEGILEKPSFRNAMKRRRCLVPADGFYEWSGDIPGRKQAWRFQRGDGGLFAFAGLWEHWMGADGSEIESAAIVTTAANAAVGRIHSRMPVAIAPANFETWLTGELDDAAPLLRAAPDDFFTAEKTVIPRGSPPPPPPADLQLPLL